MLASSSAIAPSTPFARAEAAATEAEAEVEAEAAAETKAGAADADEDEEAECAAWCCDDVAGCDSLSRLSAS